MLTIDSVRAFVQSREVELVVRPPTGGEELFLQGCFDGERYFFGLKFYDVEFVQVMGGVEVADIELGQFSDLANHNSHWRGLTSICSGPAVMITADVLGEGLDEDGSKFVVVANQIEIVKGNDWPAD